MFRFRATLRKPVSILLLFTGLIVVAGLLMNRDAEEFTLQTAIGQTNETFQKSDDFQYLARANQAFINLVAQTRSSVVQIKTETKRNNVWSSQRRRISPEEEEDLKRFFPDEDFFRHFFDRNPPREYEEDAEPTRGIGSGVIVGEDGYILTNNHVIEGTDEVKVILANGREYNAELVGRDAAGTGVSGTDLALLKIEAEGLQALPFGDSDALEVGEWVIAIGTPLNFSQTVTRGIVSAKGRSGFSSIRYGNFIQTDAPINRGNSGGALINIRGELVGINTLIATGGFTSGNIGIGFAVPSKMAQQVLPQLIKHGKVERGWLGIQMQAVDADLAEKLKFDMPRGAFVKGVSKDSPADKAGIRRSDVIVEFAGEVIRDPDHLIHAVGATEVGKSVEVKVLREANQEKRLTVKLGKRTEEAIAKLNAQLQGPGDARKRLKEGEKDDELQIFAGLRVENLTPASAERYGYSPDEKGVIVTWVASGSNAEEKGIKPGVLIQEMEYETIKDLDTYLKIARQVQANNEKRVLLYVKSPNRQGAGYITLNLNPSDR